MCKKCTTTCRYLETVYHHHLRDKDTLFDIPIDRRYMCYAQKGAPWVSPNIDICPYEKEELDNDDCIWELNSNNGNFTYTTSCKETVFAYIFMQTYKVCPFCGKPMLVKHDL